MESLQTEDKINCMIPIPACMASTALFKCLMIYQLHMHTYKDVGSAVSVELYTSLVHLICLDKKHIKIHSK